MRWKAKEKEKSGATREVERFALFPQRLDDNFYVWLEKFYIKQKYFRDEWVQMETWSQPTQNKKTINRLQKNAQSYLKDF